MFVTEQKDVVISLGGTLVSSSSGINHTFLKKFNKLIRENIKKGKRFYMSVGGGAIMRNYRDAATTVLKHVTDEDLDWLGVHSSRLNAHLVRSMFMDIAAPRILSNYDRWFVQRDKHPIIIGAGWKPGWSTNYDAVLLARDYRVKLLVNLSNVDGVYDKDPKKYSDCEKIEEISWTKMQKIVGEKWTPGLSVPFDPIATKLASKLDLTVIITNGNNLDNLDKIINGGVFKGTVVRGN